ncbi:MAG: PfkB family carbohydrate kinase, partial [Planctomycetota bacterium]
MARTVLAFGEVLWDILPSCTVLGGAPFNFIYRVNSLGDTGLMISRLGRDELGRKAHQQIIESGIDTRFIQWDDELPTGTVEVSFDEQNNPDYFIGPDVAYDRVEITEELIDAAS